MDLVAAEALARALMAKHGLAPLRWRFRWMDSDRVAGRCYTHLWNPKPAYSNGVIELSRFVTTHHTEKEVRDTILHEIAHALNDPKNQAHGTEWREVARRVGATPRATYDMSTLPPGVKKWTGTCPNGHTTQRSRRSKTSCGKCSMFYNPKYMMVWTENAKTSAPAPAPVRTTAPVSLPVAAQTVKRSSSTIESRAADYDAGTAFINWD